LQDLGRDPIPVSCLATLVTAPSHDDAAAKLRGLMATRGVTDPDALMADRSFTGGLRLLWGDADEVGEQVGELLDAALDGRGREHDRGRTRARGGRVRGRHVGEGAPTLNRDTGPATPAPVPAQMLAEMDAQSNPAAGPTPLAT
jgi:hypothetical protein